MKSPTVNSCVLALAAFSLLSKSANCFSITPTQATTRYHFQILARSHMFLHTSSSSSTQDIIISETECRPEHFHQRTTTSPAPSLEERTRSLLDASSSWSSLHFEKALCAMNGWSHRHSRKSALMVESLIRRFVQEQMKLKTHFASVVDMSAMYTCAIRGWTNSGERGAAAERAEEILDAMQKRYMDGVEGIKPNLEAFNLVLMAYARSGKSDAPQQALSVLEKLHEWYTSGATDVSPNKESYAIVLQAFAKTGKPDSPTRVKRLLEHLEGLSQQEGYASVRPDYKCHGAYISALLDASDRDYITGEEAANEIEAYLLELLESPYDEAKPDNWIFSMALAAWSKSGSDKMMGRAEKLLQMFEEYYERSGRSETTRPTTTSYNFMLACYSRSSLPNSGDKARNLIRKMQALVKSGDNAAAAPDVVSYNSVMSAYGKSLQVGAPHIVEELLRELHQAYEETKDGRLCPNRRSFNTCISAWAKSNEPGAAARIMDWIVHMQQTAEREGRRSLRPDKWGINGFLTALAKSGEPTMGEEAEEVLDQMIEYYHRGWVELKPCVLTFTNVCHCIALSGADDAVERCLGIIRRMEGYHEQGFGDVRPSCYTWNTVINAAAKSKRKGKAQIAFQILRRMQELALRPPTVTYNSVLNACGYADNPEDDPDEILDIATTVFEEANNPNYITYSSYLRCICVFVKDGTKKRELTWKIYKKCCQDGQLTQMVMKQIRRCLTTQQYKEVVADAMDPKRSEYKEDYTKNAQLAKLSPDFRNSNHD